MKTRITLQLRAADRRIPFLDQKGREGETQTVQIARQGEADKVIFDREMESGLLGRFVGDFFMKSFPGGFITNVTLFISWHLRGCQKTCLAFWNFGSGFWCVAHGHHSLMVETGEFKTVCQPLPPKLTKLYSPTRVMSLLGNHVPYAPLGIINITLIAGNDVDMDMKNTLPGRSPDIHADVVAVWLELLV